MANAVDEYIEKVIHAGDEVSGKLERIFAPTLKNSPHVDVLSQGVNSIKVIRPEAGTVAIVHSVGGDPRVTNPKDYARSVVDTLVEEAEKIGARPIAFANVIDASSERAEPIVELGHYLASRAIDHSLAVTNGEFAVLGDRVTVPANVSATMLSFGPIGKFADLLSKRSGYRNGVWFAAFNPEGKAIYLNSDGVGTKTEFYERSGNYTLAIRDSLAMKLDDLVKLGAKARVVSDVAEINGIKHKFQDQIFQAVARGELNEEFGITYIAQLINVNDRIKSYTFHVPALNLSGSAVSTINEERLRNPPKPNSGDFLVAIRGIPNPRSNGITDKRRIMKELFGLQWHKTPEGQSFMEFLGTPSTVFYKVFSDLLDSGTATSVYHMSGGAFNGKLARPFAKQGLFVKAEGLFKPDYRELTLSGASFASAETAYGKWPMGNEGFVTTSKPHDVLELLHSRGLEGKIVGQLETAANGRTGVELAGIRSSNGENVYYSGK